MAEKFAPLDTLDQMLWVADYPSLGAKRFPDRPAIIGDSGSYTYTELDHASNRFAALMEQSGIRAGERIAYIGKNNEMYFPVLFGCLRSGVVLVPINWRSAAAEVAYILKDSMARLVIYDADLESGIKTALETIENKPATLVTLAPTAGGDRDLRSQLNTGPIPREYRYDKPDDCATQLYTSGTTGHPKGVMVSHRSLSIARHIELGHPDWTDWTDDDMILSAMPNFHSGGMSWMLIGLMRSLTCILTADPSAANLLALGQKYPITRTFIVPTVVRALLDLLVQSGGPTPKFKTIYYGASAMDVDLIQRCLAAFKGCGFAQYYGMTENAGSATFLAPRCHDVNRPELLRSVGEALPGMVFEIRDPEGKVLPPRQAGELWIKSPTMMIGYWNRPDATAEALVDGWYRSGDGGYLDEEGYLFLTDRIKDMIVTGGENVYPAEVEAVLRLHPAIRDLVIVGLKDPVWSECVCAVVEWQEGKTATLDELRTFGAKQIASYKLPKQLYCVPLLPRTATGKLQRAEVRKRLAAGEIRPNP